LEVGADVLVTGEEVLVMGEEVLVMGEEVLVIGEEVLVTGDDVFTGAGVTGEEVLRKVGASVPALRQAYVQIDFSLHHGSGVPLYALPPQLFSSERQKEGS
jgi:hypothetical protein